MSGPPVRELARMRWPQAEDGSRRLLVVPAGSLEQHGPHLPLDTDTQIAVAVARRACTGRPGVALAPAFAIGSSGEHAAFPGTLSIGEAALTMCLIELGRHASLHWTAMLLVNGHGGNVPAVEAAATRLRYEGRACQTWHAGLPGGDAHAGRSETSIMLALDPGVVRLDAAERGDVRPVSQIMPLLREQGVRAVSANGVLGDPAGATAAEGEQLLAGLADGLSEAIDRLLETPAAGLPQARRATAEGALGCWDSPYFRLVVAARSAVARAEDLMTETISAPGTPTSLPPVPARPASDAAAVRGIEEAAAHVIERAQKIREAPEEHKPRLVLSKHVRGTSILDKIADAVNTFCGSMYVFVFITIGVVAWLFLGNVVGFDKTPWPLLLTILNLPQLSIMISLQVSANRAQAASDRRALADHETLIALHEMGKQQIQILNGQNRVLAMLDTFASKDMPGQQSELQACVNQILARVGPQPAAG